MDREKLDDTDRSLADVGETLRGAGLWIVILVAFGVAWLGYTIGKKLGWMR
jgi:hypothetical protein